MSRHWSPAAFPITFTATGSPGWSLCKAWPGINYTTPNIKGELLILRDGDAAYHDMAFTKLEQQEKVSHCPLVAFSITFTATGSPGWSLCIS